MRQQIQKLYAGGLSIRPDTPYAPLSFPLSDFANAQRAHARSHPCIRADTPATDEHLQLFAAIVDGWFLRHGLAMETRQASERMLQTIADADAPLDRLLRGAIPLTHASMPLLLRALGYVFEPGPAQAQAQAQEAP